MQTFIKLLYSILIASAIVTFVSLTVSTIYPTPEYPTYPSCYPSGTLESTNTCNDQQKTYEQAIKDRDSKIKDAYKKSSYIAFPAAVVIAFTGIKMMKKSDVVGEGVALGGVFTAIYATIIGSMSGNKAIKLVGVGIFLVAAIFVAYKRFSQPEK